MKKIIFYLCCIFAAITMPVEAQEMAPDKSDTIQLIQYNLEKAGKIAEYSFEKIVEAQPAKSIATISAIMILAIIGTGIFIFSEQLRAKDNVGYSKNYWKFWEGKYGGIKAIALIIIAIAMLIFIFGINSIILGFTNPEYLAIKELLRIMNSVT